MTEAFQHITENWLLVNESSLKYLLSKAIENSKKMGIIECAHEIGGGLGRLDLLYWYDEVATIYECKYKIKPRDNELKIALRQILSSNYLEAVLKIMKTKEQFDPEFNLK